jgi:hypothetical protein
MGSWHRDVVWRCVFERERERECVCECVCMRACAGVRAFACVCDMGSWQRHVGWRCVTARTSS